MNALTTQEGSAASGQMLDLSPRTFEQAITFSKHLADSDLVPKDFQRKPGNCLIAMQWGAELGLKPLQAVQSIAVINGRPAMWGDALMALVRSSPVCEFIIEEDDGKTATCRVKRRGEPEQSRTFSIEDAKAAGLAGKSGPWTQYPKRMRQLRARAFALRDVFADVLRGMAMAEEAQDAPASERDMGPAEVVRRTPSPPPAAPESYPQDEFDRNLPTWRKHIEAGKLSADELIEKVQTKAPMTEQQKDAIRACEVKQASEAPAQAPAPAAADPFLAEYDAATEGAK
jgi:hypothetical protein